MLPRNSKSEPEIDNETKTTINKMFQDIGTLFLNEEFSDVILNIQGHKLHAHKAILAARSDYFKKELFGHFQEAKQPEVPINDVSSVETFKILLKYIYTGTVSVKSMNVELIIEVLILANRFCITDLESLIKTNLKHVMNLQNVSFLIHTSYQYNFDDLKVSCFEFLDTRAQNFLTSEEFVTLTQEALIALFNRDTFYTPEIEIFKAIKKWLEKNSNKEDTSQILSCVRLSWISPYDIVSIVRPTNLIDNEILLNAVAESMGVQSKTTRCRSCLSEKNVAAKVLSFNESPILIRDTPNQESFESHEIGDTNGIIIKLCVPSVVNYFRLLVSSPTASEIKPCSYYIEVSSDFTNWKKVIDYSKFICHGWQHLYFDKEMVQYIRVVGTSGNTTNTYPNQFRLYIFRASYKSECPKLVGNVYVPFKNVIRANRANLIIASVPRADLLLNQTNNNADGVTKKDYVYHNINNSEGILIQLNQPYMVSSLSLCLGYPSEDPSVHSYRYYIKTSSDQKKWVMAADFRNENRTSVQKIVFPERIVLFIRIVGTYSAQNDGVFGFSRIECPAAAS